MRVVLVEEPSSPHSITAAMLAHTGLRPVAYLTSIAQAARWLDEPGAAWDTVVLDVDLAIPEGTGLEIVHMFRAVHPYSEIIVFSNSVTPRTRAECLAAGADAVFHSLQGGDFLAWLTRQVGGSPQSAGPERVPGDTDPRPGWLRPAC